MKDLQTVLDALVNHSGNYKLTKSESVVHEKAITLVKQMMQAEPVAWINWNAATGQRSVSFEQESELASQPLYYTSVTGDDLAEMTDLKEEREHQRDSAVKTIQELVKQRDALRAELGQYPEIQAMLMSENKKLRSEHLSATEPFEKYLKEGETPIQRLEREIKDGRALMTVYGKALGQIQELQQQQDTPVAFYDIAHDEDGEIEYEFSVYPRPGFKPLFAQAIAAPQAVPVDGMADAYTGAREDLAIWKRRALEAEELNRKFAREVNGSTFMGEPAPQAVPAVCEWKQDDDFEMGDTYHSSCGELWSFVDGGPTDNRVSYCHHCGKKVQLAAAPKGAV